MYVIPDFFSDTSSGDIAVNSRDIAPSKMEPKKHVPRYTKRPGFSTEESFFSYISPNVEEDGVK